MTVTRKWTLVAGLLTLAIFAAGWFLLVAPKRSDAAAVEAKAVSQREANNQLEQQIFMLREQQAGLPQREAYLALIRTQIPTEPALPTLIRDLTEAAGNVGVSLDVLTPGAPTAVVAPLAVVPVASGAAEGAPATDAAALTAPNTTLFEVPVALTVSGNYFELEQFVNELEGLQRAFQVTGFTIAKESAAGAGATDLSLNLDGSVFFASPMAAQATVPTPAAAPQAAE